MAQFNCPRCGSEFFRTSKTGPKTIFKVASERIIQFIQSSTGSLTEGEIVLENICCGACSWVGSLDELVESFRD